MISLPFQRPFKSLLGRAARLLAAACAVVALVSVAHAAADIQITSSFTAAQSGRTYMDVGRVWTGSALGTHDTVSFTFTNTGDATAFDFAPSVTLPALFSYVAGTATVSSTPSGATLGSVSASGQKLTFVLSPAGYDLPAGGSLTITCGIITATTIGNGTYTVSGARQYALVNAGALEPEVVRSQPVIVRAGDSTLAITPAQQTRAVGSDADFTVTVTNTGLGALFNVTINESAINPGGNLQLVPGSITRTSTNPLPHTASGAVYTLPYLGPGEKFILTLKAQVLDCGSILNTVATTDLTGATAATAAASVALDLAQPLISYTVPAIQLVYNDWAPVSIPVTNAVSAGAARALKLRTSLSSSRYDLQNLASDWTVAVESGVYVFSYTPGSIQAATKTLTFDIRVKPALACSDTGGASVSYAAAYTNTCGDAYTIPQQYGSVAAAAGTPSLSLTQTVDQSRIAVSYGGTYTLTLSATNLANLAGTMVGGVESIVVTDTLPTATTGPLAGFGVSYLANTASAGTVAVSGRTITWTVPKSALTSSQTLAIDFHVDNEPCLAGRIFTNSATTGATTIQSCPLSATASASFFVSNNPGVVATQYFDLGSAPSAGTAYETGNASANAVRDTGEGEFIPFEARYNFGPGYPGTWTGSVYTDDFGGIAAQTLVPGTLEYSIDAGGSWNAVPAHTGGTGSLTISLGFVGTAFGGDAVAGRELRIRYKAVIPDSALGGAATLAATQRSTLTLAGASAGVGICNETTQFRFTQGVFYSVGRAAATIGISEIPSILEVCKSEFVTVTVGNANARDLRNALVTLKLAGTNFIRDTSYTPVFGGAFAGKLTYSAPAGAGDDLVFTYTGDNAPADTFAHPLPANGTIRLKVIRKAIPAESAPAAAGFQAAVAYDSWDTAADGTGRVYNASTTYAPQVVRKATLAVTVTPGTIAVTSPLVSYVMYVTNTDAGTARGALLETTLPAGFTVNTAATNAANSGYALAGATPAAPTSAQTQRLQWSLGDLASGASVKITVVADVVAPSCAVSTSGLQIKASWGCSGDDYATVRASPTFVFPAGKMQVLHDSSQAATYAELCGDGKISIIVRNTGATVIKNVSITEVISATGLSYKAGSAKVNGVTVGNPVISGSNHTWTSAQIPALAQLDPVDAAGGTPEVRIDFDIATTELVAGTSPTLSVSGTAEILCGASVTSIGESGYALFLRQPRIIVTKTARNTNAGQTAYAETVYGGSTDTVEWRITVQNTGNLTASNLRLSDELSGTGGSAVIYSAADPLFSGSPAYVSGYAASLTDLPAGTTRTYVITEVLGNTCSVTDTTRDASVTWGCTTPAAGQPNTVSEPGTPRDSATLAVQPVIGNSAEITQDITALAGGRARIDVTILNTGGNAFDIVLTDTLPNANIVLDTSVTPVVSGHAATFYPSLTSVISGTVTVDNTTALSPKFTFAGTAGVPMLRYGDKVTLTYYVRSAITDTQAAASFTAAAGSNLLSAETTLDPAAPATGNNTVRIDYKNSCGTAYNGSVLKSLDLLTPDLDITATTPTNALLTSSGAAADYTFTISNSGDTGSLANFITADFPGLGAGWSVTSIKVSSATAGTNGTAATVGADAASVGGVWTFSPAQLGVLGTGGSIVITVKAAYSGTPGALALRLRVRGEARGHDGTTAYGNYSNDQRGQRVVGITLSKTLQSTSEAGSTTTNVLIGEDVTYRLRASFFGAEDELTSVVLNETPADSNTSAHFGLAYVSNAYTADNKITPASVTAPTPATAPTTLANSRVSYNIGTLSAATVNSANNIFETDVTVRVLNIAANVSAASKALRANAGLSFTYLGVIFRTNDADDGFSGGTSPVTTAELHKAVDVTVVRPAVTIEKTVRNRGAAGTAAPAFADTLAGAQADDVIEYRVKITNTGATAGLFNIVVEDTVPAKVVLTAGAAGVDTDDNGSVNTLGDTIAANKITFNKDNLSFGSAGSNLVQLNAGGSLVFLYRGKLSIAVVPNEVITNTAKVSAWSVPVDPSTLQAVSQAAAKGTAAEGNAAATAPAARTLTATDTASLTIAVIDQQKVVLETSVQGVLGSASLAPVLIGEQIRYRIHLILPQGTVPDLQVTDELPAGLALVSTPVVTFGSQVYNDSSLTAPTQPVITPSSIPASGTPLAIKWDFGQRVATGSDAGQRTVTIEYIAQVRNIAANIAGVTLVNKAAYSYNGAPTNLGAVTATIATPGVTVAHAVRNVTRAGTFAATATADAGDILEYRVTVTNPSAANRSAAYDFAFTDTLPAGLVYAAASTTATTTTGLTGTLGEPDAASQVLTWGRAQTAPVNLDLAVAGTFVFTYRATVNDSSAPLQVYTNALVADWTSLNGNPATPATGPIIGGVALDVPGAVLGERNGTGTAPNTYRSALSTTVTALNSTTLLKAKSADTLPRTATDVLDTAPSGFRIGDLVTYTVTATLQEGTLANFEIKDTLPAGLAFFDTVSILPAGNAGVPTAAAPLAYTAPAAANAPAPDALGAVTWKFGTVVNHGDNDTPAANNTLVITYRARVIATGTGNLAAPAVAPAATDTTLENLAALTYKDAASNTVGPATVKAPITVRQPRLTLARALVEPAAVCGPNILRPGETGRYRITVTNNGTAPAYGIRFTETLPAGLRGTAPVLTAATLDGTAVADLSLIARVWDNTTGAWTFTLTDAQLLRPTQTLVLDYTFAVDNTLALKGQTLTPVTGAVNEYFSLRSDDTGGHRRQYAPVTTADATIIVGLEITGFVYNDIEPNGHRDGFENWQGTSVPVYVNLVTGASGAGTVCRTYTVPASSSGTYLLERVAPGPYRVVVTKDALTPGASYTPVTGAGSPPTGWMFRLPVDGIRPVTTGVTDLFDENFGLYQGRVITGVVFKDTGAPSGTANNGLRDGTETGLSGVTVRLLNAGGAELDTTTTDGAGNFALYLPSGVTAGTPLILEETNPSGHRSTGGSSGYNRATDRIAFTATGNAQGGFAFGDVPDNAFISDGAQTIMPGATAFYRHTFVAGTAGTVTFSLGSIETPATVPWTQVVLRDASCNGTPGAVIAGPVTVAAGQEICILLKDTSPAGAPYGAVNTTIITATFNATAASATVFTATHTRQDVTTIGTATIAGLKLVKAVDKTAAKPGEILTYTITYTNNGAAPITDLFIDDRTPHYTVLSEAVAAGALPASLTGVAITQPAVNAAGAIRWDFAGELSPGATGSVVFKVKVQ